MKTPYEIEHLKEIPSRKVDIIEVWNFPQSGIIHLRYYTSDIESNSNLLVGMWHIKHKKKR